VDRPEPGSAFHRPGAVSRAAAAIEAAGFDACFVTDHPFPPRRWVRGGGHHALDPFVALAFAAAATDRLLLHTNCLIPAYRNPFVTAKSAATLDALSDGRLILGLAVGYLEGEFAALGAEFRHRGRALDEAVEMMKRAWSGEEVHARGSGFLAEGNAMLPRPVSSPHPPLWIGGNSAAALRRAVAHGDGWVPFPASERLAAAVRTRRMDGLDDLRAAVRDLRVLAEEHGRTRPLDICLTPFSHRHGAGDLDAAAFTAEVAQLARIGVTWVSFQLPAPDPDTFARNTEQFGKRVLAPLKSALASG